MPKQIPNTPKNQLLANVAPWHSDEHPGWRLNFNKLMNGLLLVVVVMIWNATSASVSSASVLVGLCFVVLTGIVVYKYFQAVEDAHYDATESGTTFEDQFMFPTAWIVGAIIAALLLCGVEIFEVNHGLHYVWSGILMLAFLVCLTAVAATQWYPSLRASWNRDEIVPAGSASKSSRKEKARA